MSFTEQKSSKTNQQLEYASFGRRWVAYILDSYILSIASTVVFGPLSLLLSTGYSFLDPFNFNSLDFKKTILFSSFLILMAILLNCSYFIYFWVFRNGQTIGYKLLSIRLIREDGKVLDIKTVLLRLIGLVISMPFLYLGLLWVLFDPKKQGWHDKIAKTLVVRTESPPKIRLIITLISSMIILNLIYLALFIPKFIEIMQNPEHYLYQNYGNFLPTVTQAPQNQKISSNRLRLDQKQNLNTVDISINQPIELDYLSKEEVLDIRKKYANQYSYLIQNEYSPSEDLFGNIVSGKPWWGLEGLFCFGNGQHSIDGLSEESRFLANPFLLLGSDDIQGYSVKTADCFAAYPRILSLKWYPRKNEAVATYDYTRFVNEKKTVGTDVHGFTLRLVDYNARDFGLNYIYVDPEQSSNVARTLEKDMFTNVIPLKGFVHLGGSCGFSDGCNNASPDEPELYFKITSTPATLYLKLWENLPSDPGQTSDFFFIVKFI